MRDGNRVAPRPGVTAPVRPGAADRLTASASTALTASASTALTASASTALTASASAALTVWASAALGADGDRAAAGLAGAAADPARAARSPSDIPQPGEPVNVATGDVLLVHQDVSRPGALPLVVGRVYRSSWRAGRWFGSSWASALDQRLQVTPGQVTGVFADGRILSWRSPAHQDGPRLPVTGPRWRLRSAGDGAFTVTDPQAGLTWRFERRPGYCWRTDGTGELPLVAVTDRAGHRIGYEYRPNGQPAWVTHSGGYRVRVVVDGGRVAALTLAPARPGPPGPEPGPEVTLVRYGYNPAGDLAAVIDSAERALGFRYDEEGRLTGWDDRTGRSFRYSYDSRGRCVVGTGPDGETSGAFAYGERVTWRTDATGAVTVYQLDGSSRVASITDPLGNVTHFWHDDCGRLVARADPLGRLTRYSYDERGNLSTITRADGSQAQVGYDEAGLPVWLEAADGVRWQQEYDPRGCLTRQIAADGAVTSYGYDQRGHLACVTSPLGAVTKIECDPAGLPVAVTGPGGGTTRCARDLFGQVTEIIGPNGAAIELAWTIEGQLAGRLFPDSSSERLDYDAEGRLVARLSPAAGRTSYEYGPNGPVSAVIHPDGTRTEFGYDHGRRLTSVTRAGLTWRYAYDAAGRLMVATDGDGGTTRYAYDQAGQLISQVNADGQKITCSYDELGRLTGCTVDGEAVGFGLMAAPDLPSIWNLGGPDIQITGIWENCLETGNPGSSESVGPGQKRPECTLSPFGRFAIPGPLRGVTASAVACILDLFRPNVCLVHQGACGKSYP